jgi:tagaturonate reductase
LDFFKVSWEKYGKQDGTFGKLAEHILGNDHIWGEDLNAIPELTHMVSTYLVAIETKGIVETLKAIENHS